jgi:hypothetical protein
MVKKIVVLCGCAVFLTQWMCSAPTTADYDNRVEPALVSFRSASSVNIPICNEINFQLHNEVKNAHVDTVVPYNSRQFKVTITPGLVKLNIITRDVNHVPLQETSFSRELVSGSNVIVLPAFNPVNKIYENANAKIRFQYTKSWAEIPGLNPPLVFAIKRGAGIYPKVEILVQDNPVTLDADVLKSTLGLRINQRFPIITQWISRPEVRMAGEKITVEANYVVMDNNNSIQHFEMFTSHNGKQISVDCMVFQSAFTQNIDGIRDEINFMRDKITFY